MKWVTEQNAETRKQEHHCKVFLKTRIAVKILLLQIKLSCFSETLAPKMELVGTIPLHSRTQKRQMLEKG